MTYSANRALELLKKGTGQPHAAFREDQEKAIKSVVEGGKRLLVVQKTGWGKSFVYFIATKLLREMGAGPALLVSPLLSLMRNQIDAAKRMGLRAVKVTSDNKSEWGEVFDKITRKEIDILLISPERLSNEEFKEQVLSKIAATISLLIVDEAHCISDWGHDFRPDYRYLERIVKSLPPNLRILATTATANNRVMRDLVEVLGPNLEVLKGDLNRNSLTLQTIEIPGQAQRLDWLAKTLPNLQGTGIIYAITVKDAELIAYWLKSRGLKVESYTGQLDTERREELEIALLENKVKALVATVALGMGYDKPDISFVIHFQMPGSAVGYYQQVGRGGRAIKSAYGILLKGGEDYKINEWFIKSAFPTPNEVVEILTAFEDEPDGLSTSELCGKVNLSLGRIKTTIDILSLESPAPILKTDGKWQLTSSALSMNFWSRAKRLTDLRYKELNQMVEYVKLPFGAHMNFLIKELDGDPDTIKPQILPALPELIDKNLQGLGLKFLYGFHRSLEPRKKWPNEGMQAYRLKGLIKAEHRAEIGRSLCYYNDDGWGKLVQEGKYKTNNFSDPLVDACIEMIKKWDPKPFPTWVTCLPSLRNPTLVPDFAKKLARALNLPFVMAITKTMERPPQKEMANSVKQARNIDGSLDVKNLPFNNGPVFLIDDTVDSKWTFTVASWILRNNGSGQVWPLALAITGQGE
ncbi:MAG: RecQ family ATP-dependent DNA helicase [Planctomycetota bacterium]|nr:RecQ family ATP-dependent DNA helicase [Planctomycetota bacterium]